MMDGGAFASSGAPAHARHQIVVANARRLAEACRARGIPVIHVWFVVEPGAPGLPLNAPLFEGLLDAKALVRGTWGVAPAPGLEPQSGDFVVEKMRMSAWEGAKLETLLKGTGRDTIINCGAWTNMSVEHTARPAADKGYFVVVPEDSCATMNADWHNASINFALHNASVVTSTDRGLAMSQQPQRLPFTTFRAPPGPSAEPADEGPAGSPGCPTRPSPHRRAAKRRSGGGMPRACAPG
jgi:gluconolactonase